MECPICNKDTIEVRCYDEYVGEHPQGGYMTFYEWDTSCECDVSDDQFDTLLDQAIKNGLVQE